MDGVFNQLDNYGLVGAITLGLFGLLWYILAKERPKQMAEFRDAITAERKLCLGALHEATTAYTTALREERTMYRDELALDRRQFAEALTLTREEHRRILDGQERILGVLRDHAHETAGAAHV